MRHIALAEARDPYEVYCALCAIDRVAPPTREEFAKIEFPRGQIGQWRGFEFVEERRDGQAALK